MNNKSIFLVLSYLLFSLFSLAQTTSRRKHINIDEDWRFAFGNAADMTSENVFE